MLASLASDLSDLTFLLVALIVFVAFLLWVLRFGEETRAILRRVSGFKAAHGDTSFEATLDGSDQDPDRRHDTNPPVLDSRESKSADEAGDVAATDAVVDSAVAVRWQAFHRLNDGQDDEKTAELWARLENLETDPRQRKVDRLLRLLAAFQGGTDPDAISTLENYRADDEIAVEAERMIGLALKSAGKPLDAADAFKAGIERAKDDRDRASLIAHRARALREGGRADESKAELHDALRQSWDDAAEAVLWDEVANACEEAADNKGRAYARLRIGELRPNDSSARFDAGYALSKVGNTELRALILHEYSRALAFNPDDRATLNNLGVVVQSADLSVLAVDYFKRAAALGNTLAASNIAYRYLNAGFVDEAAGVLDEAEKAENPHENVATARAAVSTREADERETMDAYTKQGQRIVQFMSRFAQARLRGDWTTVLGRGWESDEGDADVDVEFSVEDDRFTATWMNDTVELRVVGSIEGATVEGTLERASYWQISGERSRVGWDTLGAAFLILSNASTVEMLAVNSGKHEDYIKSFTR